MLIRCAFMLCVIAGCLSPTSVVADDEQVLRAVMHSDLKILDPGWTTAYITRNHGYMVYDTLFALDENLEVRPQMIYRQIYGGVFEAPALVGPAQGSDLRPTERLDQHRRPGQPRASVLHAL